jgi:HlyD family secretion protein
MAEETSGTASTKGVARERGGGARGRSLRKWARRVATAAFLTAVVVMLVLAWMPAPVTVDVAVARRADLRVTVDEDGRTRVKDRFVVGAPLTANVARIELHPGDAVREGDVLARLVPLAPPLLDARSRAEAEGRVGATQAQLRQTSSSIERARAALELAEREATRHRQLAAQGAVPSQMVDRTEIDLRTRREELASAQFAARVARHEVEVAQAALGRFGARGATDEQMDVRAPVDGVVLRVLQESGGAMQAGAPLLELGDPAALEIAVDVLTSDAVRIPVGARVELDRWGGEQALVGHVRRVEPSAFTRVSALGVEEQRVNVLIDLDSPREEWTELGDGFRVEAHIVVLEVEGALAVPATAVFRHGAGWAVYRVVGDRAVRTELEVGARTGTDVEVRAGLEEGDAVIVHPSDRVADGVEVERRGG